MDWHLCYRGSDGESSLKGSDGNPHHRGSDGGTIHRLPHFRGTDGDSYNQYNPQHECYIQFNLCIENMQEILFVSNPI